MNLRDLQRELWLLRWFSDAYNLLVTKTMLEWNHEDGVVHFQNEEGEWEPAALCEVKWIGSPFKKWKHIWSLKQRKWEGLKKTAAAMSPNVDILIVYRFSCGTVAYWLKSEHPKTKSKWEWRESTRGRPADDAFYIFTPREEFKVIGELGEPPKNYPVPEMDGTEIVF